MHWLGRSTTICAIYDPRMTTCGCCEYAT